MFKKERAVIERANRH